MKLRAVGLTLSIVIGASMSFAAEPSPLPVFDRLWDYDHPDSTEAKFREILPLAEASGNLDYHTQLLTQIARTQGLQMKFEEAHKTLDRVEKMLGDSTRIAKARYLLERGRVFNSSNQKEKARPFFLEAYDYSVAQKLDGLALDAAHMMGIIEPSEGQLEWNLKAISVAENSEKPSARAWLGTLYNNTGWTWFPMGQYDSALVYFNKYHEWEVAAGNEEGASIARWSIAKCYRMQGRLDEALAIQHELLKAREEKGASPDGFIYEELGELYLLKVQTDLSKKYFKLAFEELSKDEWLARDEPDRLARLKSLAE